MNKYSVGMGVPGTKPAHRLAGLIAEAERQARAVVSGPFREGARAMREAAKSAARAALVEHEWPPQDGDVQVNEVLARINNLPLPDAPIPEPRDAAGWSWWAGRDDEWFTIGPCGDRDEAIAEARDDFDGEGFYVIEAQPGAVSLNAERVLDDQYFSADDLFDYDHTEPDRQGGADLIATADAELQALLDGWVDRWRHTFVTPSLFRATRSREYVEALPGLEWKARFVKRWYALTGSFEGANEHADASWDAHGVNDPDASPEERAEAEVSYAREEG